MKTFKYFLSIVLFVAAIVACTEEEFGSTEFISTVEAPANVVALYNITQDNTGDVTITPNSEGAVFYQVYLGDDTFNPVKVSQGENITHVYPEGTYEVKIVAYGITGLITEVSQPLVVSFKAPENVEVVMENDPAISKQVNVTATADYATMYDVYFGEEGNDEPVSANIGDIASYVYQEPGTYTITVVVKSAAIETVEVVQEFEVTEILQPIEKAPTSPDRESADVVSIYSDVYTNVEVSEWNPGWGQSTELSTFVIDEDNILKYDYLNYTGIVTSYDSPTDVSAMEFVHFDYWTLGGETVGFKIVNTSYGDGDPLKESEVISTVTEFGTWVSVDIPLTDFTTDMSGVTQMLFTSNGETVFIDNLYFYRGASSGSGLMIEDFEGTVPTFIDFDGGVTTVMENPESSGINTSANVGQMLRDGGQVWGGSKMGIDYQLDFSTFNAISMKVFTNAPIGTPIILKLEDFNDGSIATEVSMPTTVSGEWETITFDYTGQPSATYDALVFLFDLGTVGDGTANSTFLYDDIQQVSSDGGGNSGDYDLSLPIDFESEGFGANWAWNVFENVANDPLEFVSNPSASGINTSSTVAKITALQAGAPWVGTETAHGEMGITWDLSASNSTIKIMVYKTVISDVGIKLVDPAGGAQGEIKVANTKINEWEELSFDFSDRIGNGQAGSTNIDQIVVFPDFDAARAQDNVVYFDNITFSADDGSGSGGGGTIAVPTSAAPTPTEDAANVISVYSDAYTDVAGTDFNPNWGQTTVYSEEAIEGNNTILYAGLNYQGIGLGSNQDVSGMDYLHIDFWTENSTALNAFLISAGPVETSKALTVPTGGGWTSIDIPLGDFSPVDLADVFQFKFDGDGDVYLDNIYFYKGDSNSGGGSTMALPFDFETAPVTADFIDFDGGVVTVIDNPQTTGNSSSKVAQMLRDGGQVWAGSKIALDSKLDLSSKGAISMKVFTTAPIGTPIALKLEDANDGGIAIEVGMVTTVSGEWETLTFDYTGQPSNTYDALVFLFDLGNVGDGSASSTFLFDDVQQVESDGSGSGGGSASAPTSAAPTPTEDVANVISVYSDAYTDIAGTDFNPDWGQATAQSIVQIEGNNTILYAGLNYQGIGLGSNQDVSSMEYLHVDYWSADATALDVYLISPGPLETGKALTVPTEGSWKSVDIPLTDFAGVNLTDIFQFKFVGDGDVYVDNIYFYKGSDNGGGGDSSAIALPFDFETTPVTTDFIDFDGGVVTVIDNPQTAGNTSAKVAQMLRDGGQVWAGSKIVLDSKLDLSSKGAISMKVFTTAPIGTNVSFKLEDSTNGGINAEVAAVTTVTGEWETLTWNFTGKPSNTYDALVFLFDLGNVGDGTASSTFLFDDIQQVDAGSGGSGSSGTYDLTLPIDFESDGFGANWAWNVFENDSDPALEFVANPDASGVNTSSTVAKITALQTGAQWVGTETVHGEMGITWDLSSSNSIIKIMVYKTEISDVGIKLVNAAGGAQGEIKVANTKINEWEELTFDFSDRIGNGLDGSTNIDQIVVFPDFTARTQDNVIYFDNITFQ